MSVGEDKTAETGIEKGSGRSTPSGWRVWGREKRKKRRKVLPEVMWMGYQEECDPDHNQHSGRHFRLFNLIKSRHGIENHSLGSGV